jgi:hypothetical protein
MDGFITASARFCDHLETLNIEHSGYINDLGMKYSVLKLTQLKRLDYSVNECATSMDDLMGKVSSISCLKDIGILIQSPLHDFHFKPTIRCDSLMRITMQKCSIRNEELMEIAMVYRNITTFRLNGCMDITDAGISLFCRYALNLKHLTLSFCHGLTDRCLEDVSNCCTNLRSLNLLHMDNITDESIIAVIIKCSQLQYLGLMFCLGVTRRTIDCLCTHGTALRFLHFVGVHQLDMTALIELAKVKQRQLNPLRLLFWDVEHNLNYDMLRRYCHVHILHNIFIEELFYPYLN